MDVLDAIRTRRSISRLSEPAPSDDQLRTILEAAACAPDHGTLRPWRFIVLAGDAKEAFGTALASATEAEYRDRGIEPEPAKLAKDRTKMARAPMVVVVACAYQPSPKIPAAEQYAAVVAATQNACLAATALGYGSMWRTGPNATNPHVKATLGLAPDDEVVGFLYLGSVDPGKAREPNHPSLDGVVSHWRPPVVSSSAALPSDERPVDPTPVHTADLPPTPIRDRTIPATAWAEAPAELLALGDDIGGPVIGYKRRIGPWLLWRAGPAVKADARYWAGHVDDLSRQHTFRLFEDGTGEGRGPSGTAHHRFRTWKEDLRDSP